MDTVFAINIAPNKDAGDNKLRRRLEPMALSSNVLNCWRNRVSQSLYVAAFIHDQVFFFFCDNDVSGDPCTLVPFVLCLIEMFL